MKHTIQIEDLDTTPKLTEAEVETVTGGALYAKFGDIEGSSEEPQAATHNNWVQIQAFSQPVYQSARG